jgi:murein DD-endopeptidase MepM/ murein hydrolase activator NlpD
VIAVARRPLWRALTTGLALGLGLLSSATALAGSHGGLTEQAAKLAELRAQIEAAEDEAALSAEQLAQAEAQLVIVLDAVRSADEAVRRSQAAVADAVQRLEVASQQLEEQRRLAGLRAAERYKDGNDFSLQALLTAQSSGEVLDRGAYLEAVGREDRRATEELDAARLRMEAEQQALQAEEASLRQVQEQQRGILVEVERLRDERALVAAADAEQLRQLQTEELHQESDLRALETLAQQPSAAPRPSSGPPPPPGADGWSWPVRGTVTSEYGQRWGRLHAGIDIAAPNGTPIYAARAGCVTFAGVQGGYGNLILIDHGGGVVTAYAHQSRLLASRGDCVEGGAQIGAVGSTGNSTGNHLHYEVRVNGSARNPRPYLP